MFPEFQYKNGLPFCLRILHRVSRNTAAQKSICVFLLVVHYFKKNMLDPKQLIFMKKIQKLIVSKPMKQSKTKTRTPFCFFYHLLRQREKNIERTFFVSVGM